MESRREIIKLRQILEARFPGAPALRQKSPGTLSPILKRESFPLERGVVTELVSAVGSGGLFLDRMLATTKNERSFAALIDPSRSFDPDSYLSETLQRLLCVFCATPEKAVKAADLLLRDGNLPLVLLDFQMAPVRAIGQLPANIWHRFQRLVENNGTALVVLTPRPMIEAARVRLVVRNAWNLTALRRLRSDLQEEIDWQVFDRRRGAVATSEVLQRTA
jgi:hypothetical protein